MVKSIISTTDSEKPFWWPYKDIPIFCGFTDQKRPIGIDGVMGIAESATSGKLGTHDQAQALNHPYVGLSLLHPMEINGLYLVCIDLDWKNAKDYCPHPTQLALMTQLNHMNVAYETSLSGHGAHYWALMHPEDIPKCINLSENRQIEFFSGFAGQKKNILLTDWDASGELKQLNINDLLPKQTKIEEIQTMLGYIPAEDYDQWIKIGMILKKEMGDLGFELWDQWSRKSEKYDPFIMSTKWVSFKKDNGVGIGSFIRLCRENGFQNRIHNFDNAEDDFAQPVNNADDNEVIKHIINSETGEIIQEIIQKDIWEPRIVPPMWELKSPNWVIDGFFADGLTLIAGAAGVGKTSAIVPLAMQVAGFYSHFSNIAVKIRRKVIYLSEDTGQVQRIQYALHKRIKRNQEDSDISIEEISDWFKVVATKRSSAADIAKLSVLGLKHTIPFTDLDGVIVDIKPLIVIDTASASFNVDSENDNAEVGKYVAAIKESLIAKDFPVWVVTHTPKALKRADVRDFSARGAGAWEGDANCVSYLFQEDGLDERFLKLGKHRYQAEYDEVAFETYIYSEIIRDNLRGMVDLSVRWAIPSKSQESKRLEAKEQAQEEKADKFKDYKKKEIVDAVKAEVAKGNLPSKRTVRDLVKGKASLIEDAINGLIEDGTLDEIPLPIELVKGAKKTSLMVADPFKQKGTNGEPMEFSKNFDE